MTALILRRPDGSVVDLGWDPHADRVYAQVMREPQGLLAAAGATSADAATLAAWVLRDVLCMPVLVANAVNITPDDVLRAAEYLFHIAVVCQEYGLGKLEVLDD